MNLCRCRGNPNSALSALIFLSACTKRVMLMVRMFIDDDTRACFENLWSVAGRRGCLLFIVNHGDDHCELFHDHQYKFNRMFVMMMMISDWCTLYIYYKLHCGSCWEGSMFINMNRAVAECSSIPIGHPHTSSIAPAIWCQNSHFCWTRWILTLLWVSPPPSFSFIYFYTQCVICAVLLWEIFHEFTHFWR